MPFRRYLYVSSLSLCVCVISLFCVFWRVKSTVYHSRSLSVLLTPLPFVPLYIVGYGKADGAREGQWRKRQIL
jgi:hypothetical protein